MNNSFSTPIGSSELIINESGKIYHLNLAPHELAETVITVGDPDRVKLVSQYFDQIEHTAQHREFVTHTGFIGKKRISVVSTGIGPDNIDIVFNELDALVNIDLETRMPKETHQSLSVIRLGTSGALQAGIAVDSFVVSSFGIGLDNLLHYYQHSNNLEETYILNEFQTHCKLTNTPIVPYIAEGSIRLRNHFTQGYKHGITVTCPGFYGPQGRVLRGPVAFPHLIDALSTFNSRLQIVTNFEMETSAIYALSKLLGHKAITVNNVIANRRRGEFSADHHASEKNLIEWVLERIIK